ncbi:GNAT family N-acetyltransferase [Streptomyces sp. NPDC048419]|uniref:GNAT family N-acetyltransferase n=1 Tax=Streptomyces sp. NPDC048419 TaxID=3365547 RepID=UPI003710105B
MTGGFRVRAMEPDDYTSVLELINADRLPGQPAADPDLLTTPAHDDLGQPATLVLVDSAARICGAAHCAQRVSDGVGLISWLHAGEDVDGVAALITAARGHLGPVRMLYAGTGSTLTPQSGTFQLPGVAQRRHWATTQALRAAGFTPAASRLYFHHPLTPPPPQPVFPLTELRPQTDPPGVQLTLFETDGQHMATAVLYAHDDEHWQLWHLAVHPDRRHRGIASHLLAQCLHTAHARGATSAIAHTDEDDHISVRLLERAGFTTIDTLTIHCRRP